MRPSPVVSETTSATATAFLPLDWLGTQPARIGPLLLRAGSPARVEYHDALAPMQLAVDLLTVDDLDDLDDPGRVPTVGPGHVPLIVGDVPPADRSWLRRHQLSFLTSEGVVELWWPKLRVSAAPTIEGEPGTMNWQPTVPLRGQHARVAQAMLARLVDGHEPYDTLGALAAAASVPPSTVSHVTSKLERHGLLRIERHGRTATPVLIDPRALAESLRAATALSTAQTYRAWIFGRDIDERLSNLSEALAQTADGAQADGHEIALTGLAAAAAHGHVRTSITTADLWLRVPEGHEPTIWMRTIGLEPTDDAPGPLRIGIDRTGVGVMGSSDMTIGTVTLPVAHRVRVWADVYDAARGPDIASQLLDWSQLPAPPEPSWTN